MEPGNDGAVVEEAGRKPAAGEPPTVGNSNSNLRYRREQDERTRMSPTGTLDASDPQVILDYVLFANPGITLCFFFVFLRRGRVGCGRILKAYCPSRVP